MFHRKHNQAGEYTTVPAGVGGTANYPAGHAGVGGTANYPAGHAHQAGRDVDMKPTGYSNAGMPPPQQSYGGEPYVRHHQYQHETPVSYGPAGQPVEVYPKKKSNRAANWCAAAFVACWACTWPCHGPCCCGV